MPEAENRTVKVEIEGGVAVITLDRPAVLNALNAALLEELSKALERCDASPEVRAIVLTGSGQKAFAAGADIGELSGLPNAVVAARKAREGQAITLQIERMRKPVIAAVNGFALGGGCELAMACDIRIAASNAKFGQPEVALGLMPGYGGSQRTTRLLGRGMALYLCLTGETIDAAEALRVGLVQQVVAPEELLERARAIARAIASKAPLAIEATKRAINGGAHQSLADALELEALEFATLATTGDFREGTTAFLEKRKPTWTGK